MASLCFSHVGVQAEGEPERASAWQCLGIPLETTRPLKKRTRFDCQVRKAIPKRKTKKDREHARNKFRNARRTILPPAGRSPSGEARSNEPPLDNFFQRRFETKFPQRKRARSDYQVSGTSLKPRIEKCRGRARNKF